MSDVLLLEIDLSSHRSIGLFILTVDSQYNAPSEIIIIIPTWNLGNDLHDICNKRKWGLNFCKTFKLPLIYFH